jgi:hypothetical protein
MNYPVAKQESDLSGWRDCRSGLVNALLAKAESLAQPLEVCGGIGQVRDLVVTLDGAPLS